MTEPRTNSDTEVEKHISENEGEFWFNDEIGDLHGPFVTVEEATFGLKQYGHWLGTGEVLDADEIEALEDDK